MVELEAVCDCVTFANGLAYIPRVGKVPSIRIQHHGPGRDMVRGLSNYGGDRKCEEDGNLVDLRN